MIINAFLGIILLTNISKYISKNKFLEYLGKLSLYIFILHQLFVPIINKFYSIFNISSFWVITGCLKILLSILFYEIVIKPIIKKISYA